MKLMVKTDKCVELLKEIQLGLRLYCFNIHCSDKFAGIIKEADNKGEAIRQYYKDKSGKDRFLTDEEAIQSVFDKDDIFCRLAFLKALTFYVLSPMVKIADKHQQLEYVKVCTVRDPYAAVILDTVESFGEPIYVKDLEDEFMEVCPDMDSIGKYLSLALSKYDEVKLPCRKKRYSMDDLVFGDNGYSRHIRKAESIGLITKEEAETILVSIWQVIDRANTIFDWIAEMYAKIESLIPSNGSYNANVQAAPDAQSAHFSVNKSYDEMQRILTALQQQGFVSNDTDVSTFYYRMTGQGTPMSNKIGWIKKGKKNNSSISKRSLVYFVETIANCRVSKAKDSRNLIENIFGLSLSSSTINSTAVCEYKTELDRILQGE
ncbi:hypothetical protein [uncultured Alistipes sp.]|uniref:hypothetical protein n=1 Tax=uncultured Alistipes sp. TaxID=538949 RepID=UPI0026DEA590|nr:hypothetical protein [uncultured Alistipes sp.]